MEFEVSPERDLSEIRLDLDQIDVKLIEMLFERAQLIKEVVHHKRRRGIDVLDHPREEAMLAHIEEVAAARDLDPRVARQVLLTVIDAFTMVEYEELD